MEQKLAQFIKQPAVFRSVYFICCMTLAFGLGIITEHSLENRGNNPVIQIPEKPMPLALQYRGAPEQNISDITPAEGSGASTVPVATSATTPATTPTQAGQNFIASKTGTKYYPADCGGVSRIKPENRIYFATEQDAQAKGYTRTNTCN